MGEIYSIGCMAVVVYMTLYSRGGKQTCCVGGGSVGHVALVELCGSSSLTVLVKSLIADGVGCAGGGSARGEVSRRSPR